ncbi:hypothetical protein DL96DRAFT_1601043 [Flagelloscypha sp. PMI_526]|nr:hypothetical protein DL96DRAFT_1601043 [Flagelloscypha sp. PMI_526]
MTTCKVVLLGVGGATCSGKTTLAKHLNRILPNSVIIHQDDFAPPQELVPIHPIHNVQDWDAAEGAIDWTRLITFLKTVKETGEIPPDHRSHDHLNVQKDVPIPEEVKDKWTTKFHSVIKDREQTGQPKVVFGLVDGFLLYWHPEVIEQLDARIFLRVPHDVLKKRRHERHGYHTAEGSLWRDPPHYWEQIVYPAYVDAHKGIFSDGDVEEGELLDPKRFYVVRPLEKTMGEIVDESCRLLVDTLV